MNEYLLESYFDDNTNNSYYTDALRSLRLILGNNKETGSKSHDSQIFSSYNKLDGRAACYFRYYAEQPEIMDGFVSSGYDMLASTEGYNSYANKYIYLIARCMPSVAEKMYNEITRIPVKNGNPTYFKRYVLDVSIRDSKKLKQAASQASAAIISAIQNGISTRANVTVDADGHATNTFNTLLDVLNKKYIEPSKKVIDTVISYFKVQCTESEMFTAQWIFTLLRMDSEMNSINGNSGTKKMKKSDGTITEYSRFKLSGESIPQQIFDLIQYKARDSKRSNNATNADNFLFKNIDDCSQSSTDPRTQITYKTKFTPRFEIPLFDISYGSTLDKDIPKSKSAKDVLLLANRTMEKLVGSTFDSGRQIDAFIQQNIAPSTDRAIKFRIGFLNTLKDVTDNAIINSKSDTEDASKYWGDCANNIRTRWLKCGRSDHFLSNKFEYTSLNPCIGGDDETARTMAKNRSGLSSNGNNLTKHMYVDDSTFTLHILGGYNWNDNSYNKDQDDLDDVIHLSDELRPSKLSQYIPPFLIKDGSTLAAIYGIVPYTTVDNGTAIDSVESSDVNSAVNKAVYKGMKPSSGETQQERVNIRLNDSTFVRSAANAGFISRDSIDAKNELSNVAKNVNDAFVQNGYDQTTVFSNVSRVFNEFTYAANIMARDVFNICKSADERKAIRSIVYADAPTVKQMCGNNAEMYINQAVEKDVCRIISMYYTNNDIGKIYDPIEKINSVIDSASRFKKLASDNKIEKALVAADKMLANYKEYCNSIRLIRRNDLIEQLENETSIKNRLDAAYNLYNYIMPDDKLNNDIEQTKNKYRMQFEDIIKKTSNGELEGSGNDKVNEIVRTVVNDRPKVIRAYLDTLDDCRKVGKNYIISVISAMQSAACDNKSKNMYTLDSNFAKMHSNLVTFASLVRTEIPRSSELDEDDLEYNAGDASDLTEDKIIKTEPVGFSKTDSEIKQAIDEIDQTGTISVDDEDVRQFSEISDEIDQIEFIASRLHELKDEIDDVNDIKELIDRNQSGKNTDPNNQVSSAAFKHMVSQYKNSASQINEKIERITALKNNYLSEHPEMRGILNVVVAGKVNSSDVKQAINNIAGSSEMLATLTPNEYNRAEYTSSDATTLAQIVYVLGTALVGNGYDSTIVDDTKSAVESLRDIISNDSGNPVSMAVIDKVLNEINAVKSDDSDEFESCLVRMINFAGGIFKKDSKTINDYISNFGKFTKERSFNTQADNGIDAFARARLRSSSSNNNKSNSDKDEITLRKNYINNIIAAMKDDIELAEFAYAVGLACGTFNRNITDERFDDETRFGRMMQSITNNVTSGDLLYGRLSSNPVQLEVLSAIIDDERANNVDGGTKYSHLTKLIQNLTSGSKIAVYKKNYGENLGNSLATKDISFDSEGNISPSGSPMSYEQIVKLVAPNSNPSSIDDLAKAARDALIPKFDAALNASPNANSEGVEIAKKKVKELLNDLDTPLSYIIAATTSVGQKAGAQAMMKHNEARLRNYGNGESDASLANDLPRIAIEQNGIIPQRLGEGSDEVDVQWIHSIANVFSSVPVDTIDAGMALNYVSMYYSSDESRNRMLLDKNGKIMYKIIHTLESLDTESGLPNGFFGNDTSEQYDNMSKLFAEFYSFAGKDGTADAMADDLEDAFMDALEKGDNSMRIGEAIPSEATRKKIAHMRLSHGLSSVIDYAAYDAIIDALIDRNYIVDEHRSHLVKLTNGIVFDDNTMKTLIERALTKIVKWNFMNNRGANTIRDMSDKSIEEWCKLSASDDDANADFSRFASTLDYEIASSKSGIRTEKVANFANGTVVDNEICKKLYIILVENGIVSPEARRTSSLMYVKGVGYTPSLVIVDAIKKSASVVIKDGFDLSTDISNEAKAAFIKEFNNELMSLKNNNRVYDLPRVQKAKKQDETIGETPDDTEEQLVPEVHQSEPQDNVSPIPPKPAVKASSKPKTAKKQPAKVSSRLASIDTSDFDE